MRPYNHNDFRHADRLNKLRLYLIEPGKFDLDNEDWEYYIRLEEAFHLLRGELSQQVAINKIVTVTQCDRKEAIRRFHEATELFGKVVDNNTQLRRAAMVEKLSIMADKCFEKAIKLHPEITKDDDGNVIREELVEYCDEKWMEMGRRLMADIAKIEGWTEHRPGKVGIDPDAVTLPPIKITSDPEAFERWRRKQKGEDE